MKRYFFLALEIFAHIVTFALMAVTHCGRSYSADSPADNFTYLGASPLWQTGQSNLGLAEDPIEGVFYTVAKAGGDPFVIVKFKLPAVIGQNCTIIQTYPGLNLNNRLGVSGYPMLGMKGLYWDKDNQWLLCSFGSFYANGANLPVICTFKPSDGTIGGPWKVNASIHSDTVKGMIAKLPKDLALEVPNPKKTYMAFGVKGSTSQGQSWGPGLVTVEIDPTLASLAEMPAKRVIHWPMKSVFDTHTGTAYGFSTFPREPVDQGQYILGNNDVNLWNKWSYQFNDLVPITSFWQSDSIHAMCEIQSGCKSYLMYFGWLARGYQWYGNNVSHQDGTAAGIQYNNNIDSLLFPGTKIKGVSNSRGGQAESYEPMWWIIATDKVVDAYKTRNQLVPYDFVGKTRTLGGTVVFGSAEVSNPVFNESTGLLRLINTSSKDNSPWVHTWSVK